MAADRQSNADPREAAGAAGHGSDDGDVVDFNALHAALGDLPPAPSSSSPALAESAGKNNAVYAPGRPHTIPPTRAPIVDPNAPSIVVADDPPTPSQPNPPNMLSQMTIPMGSPLLNGVGAVSPGPMPVAPNMHRPATPSHPFDPRHPAQEHVQQTMHMAGRPIAPPRRPRTPTMVVRPRGPSSTKKILVFVMMLLLVVGVGLVVLILLRPGGVGLDTLTKPNGARGKPPVPTVTTP